MSDTAPVQRWCGCCLVFAYLSDNLNDSRSSQQRRGGKKPPEEMLRWLWHQETTRFRYRYWQWFRYRYRYWYRSYQYRRKACEVYSHLNMNPVCQWLNDWQWYYSSALYSTPVQARPGQTQINIPTHPFASCGNKTCSCQLVKPYDSNCLRRVFCGRGQKKKEVELCSEDGRLLIFFSSVRTSFSLFSTVH